MAGDEQGLRFFNDMELTEPLSEISFGIVEVGKEVEKVIWVKNDSVAYFRNLKFHIADTSPMAKEVEILQAPVGLNPGEAAEIRLRWKPSKNLRQALEVTLQVEGEAIYMSGVKIK